MSNPATNLNGGAIHLYDQVTILGLCTGVTGSTPNSTNPIQVTTNLGQVFTAEAGDCTAMERTPDANHLGRTTDGGTAFGDPDAYTDQVSLTGVIQTIVNGPWGINGTITVKLDFSGLVVTVYSGDVVSHG
jgi:hypothetical protein